MNCVVDTNVLFSFFWKDSFTRKILVSSNNEFFSSELAIRELKKYSSLIISKTRISERDFSNMIKQLGSHVNFISKKDYKEFLGFAEKISPDKDDSEFLVLCLKMNLPLWSNDKKLKEQNKVVVLDTEDLIEVLF